MTTNQLTTCSWSTSPPGRLFPLAAIVPLLVAAASVARGVDVVAGDPGLLVRNALSGPRAMLEDRNETGRSSLGATGDGLDVARLRRPVTHVGSTSLRNVAEPLELYRIDVVGYDASLAFDPVCEMRVPTTGEHAIGLRCADDQWWFCGMRCVASFATRRRAAS